MEVPGFDLGAPIGTGGMGYVLAAIRRSDAHHVAIKVPRRSIRNALPGFREEITLTRAASMRGVVPVLGWCPGADPWMAMERIEGPTLADVMAMPRLDLDQMLVLLGRLSTTVANVHRRGIVHLDLKPTNVIVSPALRTTLIDFGIARWVNRQRPTDFITGSPRYMSVEHATGDTVDGRADVFSLGVMAYELVTGELPWVAETPAEVLSMALTQTPAPLFDLGTTRGFEPDARLDLVHHAVHEALKPDVTKRLPSAVDFARAMQAALSLSRGARLHPTGPHRVAA